MEKALLKLEDLFNRAFTPRFNPLYYLGAITVFFLWVLFATGVYLFIFYKMGSPYESVRAITEGQWHIGNVFRSVHRYAADALVFFTVLHLAREFVKGRFRHSRWLPWVSGVVTLVVIWTTGIVGYWMVWDQKSQLVAELTSKLLDYLPIFGESLSVAFTTPSLITNMFFFIALFLHLTLPILLLILLWVHVMRVTRPAIHPPRVIAVTVAAALVILSIIKPVTILAAADPKRIISAIGVDLFYLFFYPFLNILSAGVSWAVIFLFAAILVSVPWIFPFSVSSLFPFSAPSLFPVKRPGSAEVIRDNCTGCAQCYEDCPYAAIYMKQRTDSPYESEAVVMPERCASCGICVGSCGYDAVSFPLAVGRCTMEDLFSGIKESPAPVLCIMCSNIEGGDGIIDPANSTISGMPDVKVLKVPCTGMINPVWVKYALEQGAGGVFIRGCQINDCHNRTGNKWLEERFNGTRRPAYKNGREKVVLHLGSYARKDGFIKAIKEFQESIKSERKDEEGSWEMTDGI